MNQRPQVKGPALGMCSAKNVPSRLSAQIAGNLRDHIRQMIRDRRLIQIEFAEELARLQTPLDHDLFLAPPENFREVGDTRVILMAGH